MRSFRNAGIQQGVVNPTADNNFGARRLSYSNPSNALVDVANQEQQLYDGLYRPVNQALIADVNSTELVDTARANANTNYQRGVERTARQKARYGVQDTALDRQRGNYATTLSQGVNFDNLVNSARLQQYERNVGLRDSLVNQSRGLAESAANGIGTAAQLQTQRDNNNSTIKAQNSAQKTQMLGSMAAMAIMFM